MTLQATKTRSIAEALTRHPAHTFEPGPGRARKYPALKKIVSDTVASHPPHTRLPSVRTLAESLGVSLVTAQRVVTELVADGLLYSRPRAGVYVAEPAGTVAPAPGDAPASSAGNPSFLSRFKFGTDSRDAFQRPLWTGLVESFSRRYPNIQAELVFTEAPDDPARPLDVYERLDWNIQWPGDEPHLLDLRSFAPPGLARRCTEQGMLPLYYRSNYIFFNRGLLQKCGLSAPAFRTCREQIAYFRAAAPRLEKHGFNPLPFAVQQPVTLLGAGPVRLYVALTHSPRTDAADLAAFTAAVEAALDLCRLTRRGPGFNNPQRHQERAWFQDGKHAPFYFGHSVNHWELGETKLPFPLECVPTLCADDSIFLWPRVGGVSRHSRRPAESMRFLSHLLGPEAQQAFIRTGNYSATPAAVSDAPPTLAVDPAWFAGTLRKSPPVHLPSPELFYLVVNVLNNELWHALLDHVSVDDAVQQALQLGRSYLRQHKPGHAGA